MPKTSQILNEDERYNIRRYFNELTPFWQSYFPTELAYKLFAPDYSPTNFFFQVVSEEHHYIYNFYTIFSDYFKLPAAKACKVLKEHNLLTQDNYNLVLEHDIPDHISQALLFINKAGLLTQSRFIDVISHSNLDDFVAILKLVNKAHVLTPEIYSTLIRQLNLSSLYGAIRILSETNILNEMTFALVAEHEKPERAAYNVRVLNECQALTPENFASLIYCSKQLGLRKKLYYDRSDYIVENEIGNILQALSTADMLTPNNRVLLERHIIAKKLDGYDKEERTQYQLNRLTQAFQILKKASLFTQANFIDVLEHANPVEFAEAIQILDTAQILTPENHGFIKRLASEPISSALQMLSEARLLKQHHFTDIVESTNPEKLVKSLLILYAAKLITPENRTILKRHANLSELALALRTLHEGKILTQTTFSLVAEHETPQYAAYNTKVLNECQALTPKNLASLIYCSKQLGLNKRLYYNRYDFIVEKEIGNILQVLSTADMLTLNNRIILEQHMIAKKFDGYDKEERIQAQLNLLTQAFQILKKARLLTQANIIDVLEHANPIEFAQAIQILNKAQVPTPENPTASSGVASNMYQIFHSCRVYLITDSTSLLTPENQAIIKRHTDIHHLLQALQTLNTAHLLNHESFTDVAQLIEPHFFAQVLQTLNTAHLNLTTDNLDMMKRQANLRELKEAFQILHETHILTQDNINAIFSHADILLVRAEGNETWNRIPANRLTQERFNEIIRICENNRENINAGRRAFIAYVNRLLGINHRNITLPEFNGSQSTHTTSVHESVSASAIKLHKRYGHLISDNRLASTLKEVSTWSKSVTATQLDKLPTKDDKEKLAAAKRCVTRLLESGFSPFTDRKSNVNTNQLIACCWKAIHDESTRQGSQLEGRKCLVNGLYEIQRGYNISEWGVDNEQQDDSICAGGTFNKFIDAFVGFHPDFEIIHVTNKTAAVKLPCVVKEVIATRLSACKNNNPAQYTLLCDRIKKNNITELWSDISNDVGDKLFAEFHSLFPQGRQSEDFRIFVEAGQDTELSELPIFQEKSTVRSSCSDMTEKDNGLISKVFCENTHFEFFCAEPQRAAQNLVSVTPISSCEKKATARK